MIIEVQREEKDKRQIETEKNVRCVKGLKIKSQFEPFKDFLQKKILLAELKKFNLICKIWVGSLQVNSF